MDKSPKIRSDAAGWSGRILRTSEGPPVHGSDKKIQTVGEVIRDA